MAVEGLPTARVEEIFRAEHAVAVRDDDGSTHLLLYVGLDHDGGFLFLKHILLGPEHASMFAEARDPDPIPVALATEDDAADRVKNMIRGDGELRTRPEGDDYVETRTQGP